VPDLRLELTELREQHRVASEAAALETRLRREAEEDIAAQRAEHERLLERLLREQREALEKEQAELRRQVEARTDEWSKTAHGRQALETTIAELRAECARLLSTHQDEASKLQADVARLHEELASERKKQKAAPKPSPAKKEAKKKGTSPVGNLDLDEGPDAPPIAVQLANALRKHAGKVLDLFRDWDDDGNGEVSRAEFHRAMPALGLTVPKKDIDQLFTEWDTDGGGAIGYKELSKILRAKPPAAQKQVQGAASAMTAINRMQMDVKKASTLAEKLKGRATSPTSGAK